MPPVTASAAKAAKPVILLAYANDPADGINYLRNLPEEARQVRAAVEYAEAQGLCEYVLLYNATLDDILTAFQNPKYKDRIAVFHYGGHAESYELLFQSRANELQRIDGRGFAAFLAEQRGLQLVFLNACTTEPQVESLLAANVPVVIATSQEVDDAVASALAAAFYQHLARGDSIGSAYRQAVAAQRAQKGDDPALFYLPGGAPAIEALPQPGAASAEGAAQASASLAPPQSVEPVPADAAVGEQPALLDGAAGGAVAPAVQPPGAEAGGAASGGYWPWLLRTRRGAEAAVDWSLPLAAGDPLFGLPPLPPKPLPDSPYGRGLDYYTRDLAELFFGRSREIRDLYQRVTAAGRSHVILYYGQSGVGKSSLLDAGLAPRLEASHVVAYVRRDRGLGLLGTLRRQLAAITGAGGAAGNGVADVGTAVDVPASEPERTAGPVGPSLGAAWRAAEQGAGRPIVLILDQVEEAFTRRNPDLPQELEEFAAALTAIAGGPGPAPAGVLVLGFRKERLAELETALRAERIDFAKVYLAPLGEEGVQDVLWGPVRSPRLAAKYGLAVEDDLPQIVAHDLTADPDSPVAPTLQILLRKLWAAATAQNASTPRFTTALYEQLRREGILLDDFLRQQVALMAQDFPEAVASGFLLDLWTLHTTDLGTAEQCDAVELRAAYPHRRDLDAVVQRSKDLYVLVDPTGDNNGAPSAAGAEGPPAQPSAPVLADAAAGAAAQPGELPPLGSTRLAHDTLAPLVRRLYDHSTLPGQQARRLLDSRVEIWAGNPQALLDDTSLTLVERGLSGTRAPTTIEQSFLAKSREAREARKRNRQGLLAAAAAAVLLLLAMLGLTVQSRTDQQLANAASTQIAATATIDAAFKDARATTIAATATIAAAFAEARATAAAASLESERSLASVARLNTQLANERELASAALAAINESQRLAQLSQQQLTVDPVVSLHLALASLPESSSQPRVPDAEYALRQAVLASRERKYITATLESPGQIAIRGNRVALGGPQPAVYDLELNPQEFPLPPDFVDIAGLRWGNDGRLLGWNATTAWVTGGGEPLRFSLAEQGVDVEFDMIQCAEWQPAQRWVAICTFNNLYAWQPESGRVVTVTTELDTPDNPTFPRSVTWSSDSRRLAGLGAKLVVWDSRLPQQPPEVYYAAGEPGQAVTFAAWLPPAPPDAGGGDAAVSSAPALVPDDETLVAGWLNDWSSPPALQVWRAGRGLQAQPLEGGFSGLDPMPLVVLPPPGDERPPRLVLWGVDGALALFGMDGARLAAAEELLPALNGVVLSPDGDRLAGYSADGSAVIWHLDDLSVHRRFDVTTDFTADSLVYAGWLDANTLALADASGLVQAVAWDDLASSVAITRLYGYSPRDRLAKALRLANGRLLTAAANDGGAASLRIWQLDPIPLLRSDDLPSSVDDLCRRVQRALALPWDTEGLGVLAWYAGDELLVTDRAGQVVHWSPGGAAAPLPPDETRRLYAVAPDGRRVLRYDDGADGEIWRLDDNGWMRERAVAGELTGAAWTEFGLLVSTAGGAVTVLDPQTGKTAAAPPNTVLGGTTLAGPGLLLAQREGSVEMWQVGGKTPLAAWPIPPGRRLRLDRGGASSGDLPGSAAPRTDLFVYRDVAFGQLFVLRVDAAARTLQEVWRAENAAVDSKPARLHPQLPLLAVLNNGVVSLVDLATGAAIWQSTSVGAVAGQWFLSVSWSTDGQYLITQAQPLQGSSFVDTVAVWRWDPQVRRPILLQQTPVGELLGISPDLRSVLAAAPGRPNAAMPLVYPVLPDAAQLRTEVEASCLLDRPLRDDQRQAFMVAAQ